MAGLAGGAFALTPLRSMQRPVAREPVARRNSPIQLPTTLRVGVLLARSNIYPAMGQNLLAGMRLYAEQARDRTGRRAFDLVSLDAGFGSSLAVRAARRLIEADRVDLVVCTLKG